MQRTIVVVDYDPQWPHVFERIASIALGLAGGVAIAVEHVGSTSVVGLAAKPVIDLDVLTPDDLNAIERENER